MAAEATQRFSEQRLSVVAGKWTAVESYNVINAATKDAARAAVVDAFGVNVGTQHPDNPAMQLQSIDATNYKGPTSWIVTTPYAIGDPGTPDPSPLDQPPRLLPQWQTETIPGDIDVGGNAIVTSAGNPFDPPAPRRRRVL